MLKRLQNSCTLPLVMNETTRSLNDECGQGASMPTGRELYREKEAEKETAVQTVSYFVLLF